MKNSKTMRVAVLLLALTLITSCFVGSTFAKYTSSASGTDTATVAKWSIKVGENGVDITGTDTVAFDLFTTIKDSDGITAEADVVAGKIAPGTSGSFSLKVTNDSEVTATYTIDFTIADANVPLQFKLGETGTWTDSLQPIEAAQIAMSQSSTTTVYWRWAFEGGKEGAPSAQTDTTDTALGIAAQSTVPQATVTATITATQVD